VNSVCDIGAFEYGDTVETPGPTATPGPLSRVDVNCDDRIAPDDALIVLRRVAGLASFIPEGCPPLGTFPPETTGTPVATVTGTPLRGSPRLGGRQGDADCNGGVDAVDALVILRYVVGIPKPLQAGCPPLE
jgi:hypothetical protein